MRYEEAPSKLQLLGKKPRVFLAGGITSCPDWQKEMVELLAATDLVLLNPRRKDFPIGDPDAAFGQIRWEYKALRLADAILFWFPCETLCPIVLYELGAWSMTDKSIFVGVHKEYKRRQDVEIQTGFVRPNVEIAYSLPELAQQVIEHSGFINFQRVPTQVLSIPGEYEREAIEAIRKEGDIYAKRRKRNNSKQT